MQALAIAAVTVLIAAVLLLCAYLVLKNVFPQHLETLFAIGEEKWRLTKSDSRAHYYAAQQQAHDAENQRPKSLKASASASAAAAAGGGQCNLAAAADCREEFEDSDSAFNRNSPGDTTGSEYEHGHNLPRVGSAESLASDASVMDLQPDVSNIGQVEVGLEYDRDIGELVVSLIQARDLSSVTDGELDFYATIAVYPDAANVKSQTKLAKNSPNPVFKERFLYSVEPHQMAQKTVQVNVYSIDAGGRHVNIGQTEIRLADVELQRPLRLWLNLREQNQRPSIFGEVMFSLSYLPTAERLTVVIVKAKNLKWPRSDQIMGDLLVKAHLILNGKRVAKKKTSVKKNESQPTYNEAMIFNVSQANLSAVQLRLTVADVSDDRPVSIGHVIIGANTGGTELTHWQQMVTSLRKPVAMWHHLRKK